MRDQCAESSNSIRTVDAPQSSATCSAFSRTCSRSLVLGDRNVLIVSVNLRECFRARQIPTIEPSASIVPGSPTGFHTSRWYFLSTMVSRSRICV